MGYKIKLFVLLSILVFAVSGFYYLMGGEKKPKKELVEVLRQRVSSKKEPVYLYFADKRSTFLVAEETFLSHPKEPASFGKLIIKTLIDGSISNRESTLPKDTKLRTLFVDQDGTAYVDFAGSIKEIMKTGCYDEIIAVYSVVNSLVLNIPEIKRVKILIGGQESETLSGHLDLSQPFKANMYLVR